MKSYSSIVVPLLVYFDQNLWNENLSIKNIFIATLEVAIQESVQLNYEVYLISTILDYLKTEDDHTMLNALEMDKFKLNFVNYKSPLVKMHCLRLLDELILQKVKGPHILIYSSDKIIKCLCFNLGQVGGNQALTDKIYESFKIYLQSIAPDTLTFMTILNQISQEVLGIIDNIQHPSKSLLHIPQSQQMIASQVNGAIKQVHSSEPSQHFQQQLPGQIQLQQASTPQQTAQAQPVVAGQLLTNSSLVQSTAKRDAEAAVLHLKMIKLALEQSSMFHHPTVLKDEIFRNIIQISDHRAHTIECYEIINRLCLMRMKWSSNENLENVQNNRAAKSEEQFLNISLTSLNYILYKMWNLLDGAAFLSRELGEAITASSKIGEFISTIQKRGEPA